GFPVTFEGVYRWIVFLPSKIHSRIPVLNRYYGVLKDGRIKDRGIATRRGDMPPIIKRCIWEILDVLAEARNAREFYEKLRTTPKIINRYIRMLREGVVPVEMLTIQKRLSKKPSSYKNKVCQAIAAEQLSMGGGDVRIGEDVSYIIVNSRSKIPSRRVLASALVKGRTYDADAYVNLLLSAVETMLKPFHFTLKPMFCLDSKLSVRSR
ncbi:MAG: DNA polymerase domain-containing protein, partial [Candidatus Bathyarchaeia archaeon]